MERERGLEPPTLCLGIRFGPDPPLSTGVLSCILRGLGLIFGRTEHPRMSAFIQPFGYSWATVAAPSGAAAGVNGLGWLWRG